MKAFDRKDGNGVDWLLVLESLFRAGFQIADARPDDDARRAIMRRVHEGAYNRLAGNSGAEKSNAAGPLPVPSADAAPQSPAPRRPL